MNQSDLQDLIDNAAETLEVELKDWLDLKDNICRATLARHIAAMANHGGGYILIGFDDTGRETTHPTFDAHSYNRDTVNAIVKRYLVPTFQCEVAVAAATASEVAHPVVWIPSHKSVPVCAQADGPHDDKGRPQGIKKGTYYTRAPGPESAPITTPEAWRPLVHRCVLNERQSLLGSISAILGGREETPEDRLDLVSDWHKRSHGRFETVLQSAPDFRWKVPYVKHHYQLSYRIVKDPSEALEFQNVLHILQQANQEVRELVWTGWSMFYPFTRDEIKPYVVPEQLEGIDTEVWETSLIGETQDSTTLPDFWRFSVLGYASLARAYREDRQAIQENDGPLLPGTWFSPFTLIRELSEFIRHARAIGRLFSSSTEVEVMGTWVGLANRRIDEFNPGVYWSPHKSRSDRRDVRGRWSMGDLTSSWESIVAELLIVA